MLASDQPTTPSVPPTPVVSTGNPTTQGHFDTPPPPKKRLSQKQQLLIIGTSALVMLIVALLFRALTPAGPATPPSTTSQKEYSQVFVSSAEKPTFSNVGFTFELQAKIPTELSTYTVSPTEPSFETLKNSLISTYGLTQSSESAKVFANNQTDYYLEVKDQEQSLALKRLKLLPSVEGGFSNQNSVITTTVNELQALGFTHLGEMNTQVTFFKGAADFDETTLVDADYAQITFTPKLPIGEVYSSSSETTQLSVLMDTNFKINKLEYTTASFTFEPAKNYPTVSAESIANQLINNNQQFEVVSMYTALVDRNFTNHFDSYVIESVRVVYRYNESKTTINPYLFISGTGRTTREVPYTIEMIVPAIVLPTTSTQ